MAQRTPSRPASVRSLGSARSARGRRQGGPKDIFETHTIVQIRQVEKQNQQKIEQKAEELRQLVGARYRDLLEAADTIVEMRNLSTQVVGMAKTLQESCQGVLSKTSEEAAAARLKEDKDAEFEKKDVFTVAAQLKLLVSTPELIWAALEGREYLRATQLYVLAENIHHHLRTDMRSRPILSKFPVLERQWGTLSNFPAQIAAACETLLGTVDEGLEVYAGALVATAVLAAASRLGMLSRLLRKRLEAIQEALQRLGDNSPSEEAVASACARVVGIIQGTFFLVHSLFLSPHSNLIASLLALFTPSADAEFDSRVQSLFGSTGNNAILRRLPPEVKTLTRRHGGKYGVEDGTVQSVRDACVGWLESCRSQLKDSAAKALSFVTTGVGLAAAQVAVWRAAALRLPDGSTDATHAPWDEVCAAVVGRQVALWDELWRDAFHARGQQILTTRLGELDVQAPLDMALPTLEVRAAEETDLGAYFWTAPPANRVQRTPERLAVLAHKSVGLTRGVAAAVELFDRDVAAIVADVKALSHEGTDPTLKPTSHAASMEELRAVLRAEAVRTITTRCQARFSEVKTRASRTPGRASDGRRDDAELTEVLLYGRIFEALATVSKQLPALWSSLAPRTPALARAASRRVVEVDPEERRAVARVLHALYVEAYTNWVATLAADMSSALRLRLTEDDWAGKGRRSTWAETLVEEETEDGQKVQTPIRLPGQPSPYVLSSLFDICLEIERVGGHSLHVDVRSQLMHAVRLQTIRVYKEFLASTKAVIGDVGACQLLFDVQFLNKVLADAKTEESLARRADRDAEELQADLRDKVDPVDIVIYDPQIRRNTNVFYQGCGVLLGFLAQLNPQSPSSDGVSAQQSHNVMSLAPLVPRFSSLPVSAFKPLEEKVVITPAKIVDKRETATPEPEEGNRVGQASRKAFSYLDNVRKNVASGITSGLFGRSVYQE